MSYPLSLHEVTTTHIQKWTFVQLFSIALSVGRELSEQAGIKAI